MAEEEGIVISREPRVLEKSRGENYKKKMSGGEKLIVKERMLHGQKYGIEESMKDA